MKDYTYFLNKITDFESAKLTAIILNQVIYVVFVRVNGKLTKKYIDERTYKNKLIDFECRVGRFDQYGKYVSAISPEFATL